MIATLLSAALALPLATLPADPVPTRFVAEDGLMVNADLWIVKPDTQTPFVVLFHQARWSRGEYIDIAQRLNTMGFNCMAVDARSGHSVKGIDNGTAARAKAEGMDTGFMSAAKDLRAALEHARSKYAKGDLIAWGSSYSASLVLLLAAEDPNLVDGIVTCSPGEYFSDREVPEDFVARHAKKIVCPVFVTSAKQESGKWAGIFKALPKKTRVSFVPESAGEHGSRALWPESPSSDEYWDALMPFLARNFLLRD